jgi:hypothetical protein
VIFDADTAESARHWQRLHEETGVRGIALTAGDIEVENACFVQKPITPSALLSAAAELRRTTKRADRMPREPVITETPSTLTQLTADTAPTPEASTHVAEGVTHQPRQIAPCPEAPGQLPRLSFSPRNQAPTPAQDEPPRPTPDENHLDGAYRPLSNIWLRLSKAFRVIHRRYFTSRRSANHATMPSGAANEAAIKMQALSRLPSAPKNGLSAKRPDNQFEKASPDTAPPSIGTPIVTETARNAVFVLTASAGTNSFCLDAHPEASAHVWRNTPARQFDPEKYLVGPLREAFLVSSKWRVITCFDIRGTQILVDAPANKLICKLTAAELDTLAQNAFDARPKVTTLTKRESDALIQPVTDPGACAAPDRSACGQELNVHRLDNQLWRAAMHASAGRLPKGVDPEHTTYLSHWPNLTRLERVGQVERLAALWALRGFSIARSTEHRIPQCEAVVFYSAAWALDLLTEDDSFARNCQVDGSRNRGVMSNLLKWLQD